MNYIEYFEGGKSLPKLSPEKQAELNRLTALYK